MGKRKTDLTAGTTALVAYPDDKPNRSSGTMRDHVVRVKFQHGRCTAVRETTIGGNTMGFDVMEAAVRGLCEEIASECDDGGEFVLTDQDGNTIAYDASSLCDINNEVDERELYGLVVSVEIASVRDEARAAKKARRK